MILHDWTTYFFAGCVVAGGLGLAYYWEHYDIVRFDESKEKQFNEPAITSGKWRCGHLTDPVEVGMYVVYVRSGERHLGRVCAIEGQKVEVTKTDLLVDGKTFEVIGVRNKNSICEAPEVTVPRRCVYALSDERTRPGSAENDSRCLGPVPLEAVTHAFRPEEKK